MKPFFTAEDFKFPRFHGSEDDIAAIVNAKLEQEGRVVYGHPTSTLWHEDQTDPRFLQPILKALLLIQPIEEKCVHHAFWVAKDQKWVCHLCNKDLVMEVREK